jgi:hypothetical protein
VQRGTVENFTPSLAAAHQLYRRIARISPRLQLRRPRAVQHRTTHGNIIELLTIGGTPQQQTAPTHIAAANKFPRKPELITKMGQQNIDVFLAGDAS